MASKSLLHLPDFPQTLILAGRDGRIEVFRDLLSDIGFFVPLLRSQAVSRKVPKKERGNRKSAKTQVVKVLGETEHREVEEGKEGKEGKEESEVGKSALVKGNVDEIKLETEIQTLRNFRGFLYSQFLPKDVVELVELTKFCDRLSWDRGVEIIEQGWEKHLVAKEIWLSLELLTPISDIVPKSWEKALQVAAKEVLQNRAAWSCHPSVMNCFDTLPRDTTFPESLTQAQDERRSYYRCCQHSLQGAKAKGIEDYSRSRTTLISVCYNVSLVAEQVATTIGEEVITRYCCCHRRPTDETFAALILEFNTRRHQKDLSPLLAKLTLDVQSAILKKVASPE